MRTGKEGCLPGCGRSRHRRNGHLRLSPGDRRLLTGHVRAYWGQMTARKILGTGSLARPNPDLRKANVMEHLLDQLNGAIDGIASCLADPIHDEWFQTGKATQTLKEAARRLKDIAHGIQIERDQYLESMSE
jgi:hypothetical protein